MMMMMMMMLLVVIVVVSFLIYLHGRFVGCIVDMPQRDNAMLLVSSCVQFITWLCNRTMRVSSTSMVRASDWITEGPGFKSHLELGIFSELSQSCNSGLVRKLGKLQRRLQCFFVSCSVHGHGYDLLF